MGESWEMPRKSMLKNRKLFQMYLSSVEQNLLEQMADADLRSKADMARLLIREGAEKRGIRLEERQAEQTLA